MKKNLAILLLSLSLALTWSYLTHREVVCRKGERRWTEEVGMMHLQCGTTVVTILDDTSWIIMYSSTEH